MTNQAGPPPDDQPAPPVGPSTPRPAAATVLAASPADPTAPAAGGVDSAKLASPCPDQAARPPVPEPRRPGRSDTPSADTAASPRTSLSGAARRLLLRLHFYAGVLVAPFLVVAALTGLAYTFTPQLDRFVYAEEFFVDEVGTVPRPLVEQINAALAAHPEGTFASVLTGDAPDRTSRVVLAVPELGDKQRTVYVDPYTSEVTGALTTWWGSTPLTTWLDELHRDLHLGELGLFYSELAASWLWVVALGGLVLWLARRRGERRVRGVVLPDLTAGGRRRTMSWHGSLGVWLLVGLLFLSVTGLTWSTYAGATFSSVLDAADGQRPSLDTTLPQASADGTGDTHEGHTTGGSAADPGAPDVAVVETVLATAREAGLDGPVEVSPPAGAGTGWSVAQTDTTWPVRLDQVAVDPAGGTVVDELSFADWPLLAQLTKFGVNAHMGRLFGLANQVLLAGLTVGLLCMVVWGYRLWWQRRPTRAGRTTAVVGPPPPRGAWRRMPRPALAMLLLVTAAVGWALPVFGVTLAAFLVLDLTTGLARRRRTKPANHAAEPTGAP